MSKMPTEAEQRRKLFALQQVAGTYEVNTFMHNPIGDVLYVAAAFTPRASHVCSVTGPGYDVWRWRGEELYLAECDLDIGAAANIVIVEYMTEKVQRAKRANPNLRQHSDKELLNHLLKGYQRNKPVTQ